jgi:protein-tyrosine phosphatase
LSQVSSWFLTYGFADVLDNLLIGAYPLDREDVTSLERLGIVRVLNLVEDSEYRQGERDAIEAAYADLGIEEERLELTDFGGLRAEELEAAVRTLSSLLEQEGGTYLHCRAGWQ